MIEKDTNKKLDVNNFYGARRFKGSSDDRS